MDNDVVIPIEVYIEIKKELEELQNNWNELEEHLKEMIKELNPDNLNIGDFNLQHDDKTTGMYLTIIYVLTMMTEIKEGNQ